MRVLEDAMRCNKMSIPDDVRYIELGSNKAATIYDIGTTNDGEDVFLHLDDEYHVVGIEIAENKTRHRQTVEI